MPLKFISGSSGILFICAAGNRGGDTVEKPIYPAAFDINNILSVTAIDSKGLLPDFASYGDNIDVAAPGTSVISTKPCGGYDYYSGTSVSAAIVSGITALVRSYLPEDDIATIKNRIISSVTPCTALNGKVSSGGRVDAYGALTGMVQASDSYIGESEADDILPVDGDGEADTWYIMNELASNVERFHYGEGGINPSSGNYSVTCTDMSVPASGFSVEISRTYNSKNQRQTLLGRGWTFGFEGKVTYWDDAVEISLPNGSCHVFKLKDGKYVGEGTRASFEKNVSGVDILTTTDQNGNVFQQLKYLHNMGASENKVVETKDAAGETWSYSYDTANTNTTITNNHGKKWIYWFDIYMDTIRVRDPEGKSTYTEWEEV